MGKDEEMENGTERHVGGVFILSGLLADEQHLLFDLTPLVDICAQTDY